MPDVIAKVALYPTERTPIPNGLRCPYIFPDGAYHDGCLHMEGQLAPGETTRAGIEFLDPDTVLPKLREGAVLYLWPGRKIGSATVLQIRSAT